MINKIVTLFLPDTEMEMVLLVVVAGTLAVPLVVILMERGDQRPNKRPI